MTLSHLKSNNDESNFSFSLRHINDIKCQYKIVNPTFFLMKWIINVKIFWWNLGAADHLSESIN